MKPQTKVRMINSVGGKNHGDKKRRWTLDAGKEYWLDADLADNFIIRGYADGNLSRNYSDDELAEIRAGVHTINLNQEGIING